MRRLRICLPFIAIAALLSVSGCRRSADDFDNRTLEKRPHVETVAPENKADPFRP